jgi:hypothetical protein
MSRMTAAQIQATFRRQLAKRPGSAALYYRLGTIVQPNGSLRFVVGVGTARRWFAGDPKTEAAVTQQVDRVAETYDVDVSAIAPGGVVLYRRMHA